MTEVINLSPLGLIEKIGDDSKLWYIFYQQLDKKDVRDIMAATTIPNSLREQFTIAQETLDGTCLSIAEFKKLIAVPESSISAQQKKAIETTIHKEKILMTTKQLLLYFYTRHMENNTSSFSFEANGQNIEVNILEREFGLFCLNRVMDFFVRDSKKKADIPTVHKK